MRRARLRQLLAADPEFGFAHVLKGYFLMLSFNAAHVPAARAALDDGPAALGGCHARASRRTSLRWRIGSIGDIDATLGTWEQILAEHPLDVLAFRLHHFLAFWYGRPDVMAAQADAAMQRWSPELAGWPALLACRCFAHEELGNYAIAEAAGREAIALAPGDLWAAHGVAHVLEMQGRREEGIAWLAGLEPNWEGGNNLCTISGGTAVCTISSGASSARCSTSTTAASAISPPRSPRPNPTSTSTSRTPPPCCSGWSGRASTWASAGASWPTRRRRASAIASPCSPCRTG